MQAGLTSESKTTNPFSPREKAAQYTKGRPDFPDEVYQYITDTFSLTAEAPTKRILDLGTGTGELSLPLAPYFQEVVAVDPSAAMLAEAQQKATARECGNIHFIKAKAEELNPEQLGQFDLITIANAYHWMDPRQLDPLLKSLLKPEGSIIFVTSYASFWRQNTEWQKKMWTVINKNFLEEEITALQEAIDNYSTEWHKALNPEQFKSTQVHHVKLERLWTCPKLLDFLYSISSISAKKMEARQATFEKQIELGVFGGSTSTVCSEPCDIPIVVSKL